jgi:HEAT repeat protein
MLEGLLASPSEAVAVSAIRSLGQQSSPLAVRDLNQLLYAEERSANVRAEAALALGAITRPEAMTALVTAMGQVRDEAVASQVIRAIAGRPFEETGKYLQMFLESPRVSAELKAEALYGLSRAQGDATAVLISYAQNSDSDLRAAAARALGLSETRGNVGAEIVALLKDETNPLVRKRLYLALANQQGFDLGDVWAQTANESDPLARLAGMELLAKAVQRSPTTEMVTFFDENALPELMKSALDGDSRDQRLGSVMVLRRAKTQNANAALREIAQRTTDATVAEATGVLASSTRRR